MENAISHCLRPPPLGPLPLSPSPHPHHHVPRARPPAAALTPRAASLLPPLPWYFDAAGLVLLLMLVGRECVCVSGMRVWERGAGMSLCLRMTSMKRVEEKVPAKTCRFLCMANPGALWS